MTAHGRLAGYHREVLNDCPYPVSDRQIQSRSMRHAQRRLIQDSRRLFRLPWIGRCLVAEFLAARLSTLNRGRGGTCVRSSFSLMTKTDHRLQLDWAEYVDGDAQTMLLQETIAPMSPTVMYRRAPLERHGWNEQAKLEDYELYLRLTADGDFAFDPQVLSAWRQHGHNTSKDFSWMIDARLAAQRRVADYLGLTAGELERLQRASQFAGAEDLLRLGEKSKAFKLLRHNLAGAPSAAALLRSLARLCGPFSLITWHKKRKQKSAVERFGPPIIKHRL